MCFYYNRHVYNIRRLLLENCVVKNVDTNMVSKLQQEIMTIVRPMVSQKDHFFQNDISED